MIKDELQFQLWRLELFLPSKKGQAQVMWRLILIVLAILVIIAMGMIYKYATKQGEKSLLNVTRIWRRY